MSNKETKTKVKTETEKAVSTTLTKKQSEAIDGITDGGRYVLDADGKLTKKGAN